jgi:prevent-host-death family protein
MIDFFVKPVKMSLDSVEIAKVTTIMKQIMKSDEARLKWRDLIDRALSGADTVIERYNKPAAVVIPFEDYAALQEELEDLRAGRRAEAAYQEWVDDPTTGEDWEKVKAELLSEGTPTSD